MNDTLDTLDTLDLLEDALVKIENMAHRSNGGYNDERDIDPASVVSRHYSKALVAHPAGTMRDWMTAHKGQQVHTVQVGYSNNAWAPTFRYVNTKNASYVELDGSRRDYRGARVIHTTPDALIVQTEDQAILYVAATPTE